jgi:hypothetical protein
MLFSAYGKDVPLEPGCRGGEFQLVVFALNITTVSLSFSISHTEVILFTGSIIMCNRELCTVSSIFICRVPNFKNTNIKVAFVQTSLLVRARIFKLLRSPRTDSEELIPPLCSLSVHYDNPIPIPSPHRLFKNSTTVDKGKTLLAKRKRRKTQRRKSQVASCLCLLTSGEVREKATSTCGHV